MSTIHGFELMREQALPEANSIARLYRHARTGAELLSLINDDENKVFGITFRTPPADSTGVAHILEHAVLCGSRKYPVKEPFVELMKGSLYTFLNAFTYPDKTCYPVASQNFKDFYNLIDVYLDAVFYPRLTPHTFQQEGWHYEIDKPDQALVYKGVVFNEMKGNYSSPDDVLDRLSQQSLYPDITYGLDSGGDPKRIPDLTYEQLKSFHARYYHPSNARVFFYGDDDPDERLRFMDAWLADFEPITLDSGVGLQPRYGEPRRLDRTYIAGPDGDAKAMVTVNWMFDEPSAVEDRLALAILNHILIGTPASPLRKALIDSGLGEALAGDGLGDHLRQPMFSVGLKGVDPDNAERVESLILDTLKSLAESGIDRQTVEASLNTVEFALRENNTGSFPRGIALMLRALKNWLYDRDPIAPLAFEAPLAAVKAHMAAGERHFESLIGQHLLANPHRTTIRLRPDPTQAEVDAAEERDRLAAARQAMSKDDIAAAIEATAILKRLQETADPPEALAAIPRLTLADLPRTNKPIPIEVGEVGATKVLFHDLPTNGIVYIDAGLDLHQLPAELLPYVEIFARALLETGAGRYDFVELAQRIGRSTGGIDPETWTSAMLGQEAGVGWLFLRAKAMPDKVGELLAILRDVLTEARLDNRDRLNQLVVEEKAMIEAQLVQGGSRFVNLRLRSRFHEADWAAEQMNGISYLFFLRDLVRRVETDQDAVTSALQRMRDILVNRRAMLVNVTTDAGNWRRLSPQLAELLEALPLSHAAPASWSRADGSAAQGLTIPAKVNYVGKGADLYRLGYRPSGASLVVAKLLSTTWLWDKVRVQGGAYGGYCSFDRYSGGFTFLSYRDPNLVETLDIYDASPEFLRAASDDKEQLSHSIIGAIGAIDAYMLPSAKGIASMRRYLVGDTDEMRQRMREEVLATTPVDVRVFADALAEVTAKGDIAVLGSPEAIASANAKRPGLLKTSQLL